MLDSFSLMSGDVKKNEREKLMLKETRKQNTKQQKKTRKPKGKINF